MIFKGRYHFRFWVVASNSNAFTVDTEENYWRCYKVNDITDHLTFCHNWSIILATQIMYVDSFNWSFLKSGQVSAVYYQISLKRSQIIHSVRYFHSKRANKISKPDQAIYNQSHSGCQKVEYKVEHIKPWHLSL